MTVTEFKNDPELVKHLRAVLDDPVFKLWMNAIDESVNPIHQTLDMDRVSPHGAHIHLGLQKGFNTFRHVLLSGGGERAETTSEDRGEQSYADDPDKPPTDNQRN